MDRTDALAAFDSTPRRLQHRNAQSARAELEAAGRKDRPARNDRTAPKDRSDRSAVERSDASTRHVARDADSSDDVESKRTPSRRTFTVPQPSDTPTRLRTHADPAATESEPAVSESAPELAPANADARKSKLELVIPVLNGPTPLIESPAPALLLAWAGGGAPNAVDASDSIATTDITSPAAPSQALAVALPSSEPSLANGDAQIASLLARGTEPPTAAARSSSATPPTTDEAAHSGPLPQRSALPRAAEVLRQVRVQVVPNMRQATIQLVPAELGRIWIRIRMEDNELRAVVRAECAETLRVLDRHLPELRASLAQQGIQAQHFDLALGFQDQSSRGTRHNSSRGAHAVRPPETDRDLATDKTYVVRSIVGDRDVDTYA